MMKDLEKRIESISGKRVLDVACGRGEFIGFIKNFNGVEEIVAIDTAAGSAKVIADQYPNDTIEVLQMNAEEMDFSDNSFDVVCISNSLHHLPQPQKVLAEMLRVLRPGGTLVCNEMLNGQWEPARMSHVYLHHFWAVLDRERGMHHDPTLSRDAILQQLKSAGLQNMEVTDYTWPVEKAQDPGLINNLLGMFERGKERIQASPSREFLVAEQQRISNHVRTYGYAPAPSIFVTGTK
jgi:ubiquinone/menaquinone biosynthesis C-methylase UbiE